MFCILCKANTWIDNQLILLYSRIKGSINTLIELCNPRRITRPSVFAMSRCYLTAAVAVHLRPCAVSSLPSCSRPVPP